MLNLDKNTLIKKYINEFKSLSKVSKELNCSHSAIRAYLKKYNIRVRSIKEATKLRNFSGKNNNFYGKHHTRKNRLRIGLTRLGKPLSISHRKKLSNALSGKNNPMYGKNIQRKQD